MKNLILIVILLLSCLNVFGQISAIHFNADWNNANNVEWFEKLSDVNKGDCQKKYGIAIVPTIVLFNDGEEVKRFQADLSFKMLATREEIQEYIDELIMSQF